MAAGNGAERSDRIERGIIRSLHFITFPAAIQKCEFVSGPRRKFFRTVNLTSCFPTGIMLKGRCTQFQN